MKVVFEAKRGDAKDAMVAIDDVRLVRCSRRPKTGNFFLKSHFLSNIYMEQKRKIFTETIFLETN